jgi:hypothetical protein
VSALLLALGVTAGPAAASTAAIASPPTVPPTVPPGAANAYATRATAWPESAFTSCRQPNRSRMPPPHLPVRLINVSVMTSDSLEKRAH